jgi:hypothetical protein
MTAYTQMPTLCALRPDLRRLLHEDGLRRGLESDGGLLLVDGLLLLVHRLGLLVHGLSNGHLLILNRSGSLNRGRATETERKKNKNNQPKRRRPRSSRLTLPPPFILLFHPSLFFTW